MCRPERRCGVSLDGPLCAVQKWVSAIICLSTYLTILSHLIYSCGARWSCRPAAAPA